MAEYLSTDTDDDDFEERFELWMELTDEQQDAELSREMDEYNKWWDSLTTLRRYRISRRTALEGCMIWRRSIRQGWTGEFFDEQLRNRQKRLLALRIERSTGVYPGEA